MKAEYQNNPYNKVAVVKVGTQRLQVNPGQKTRVELYVYAKCEGEAQIQNLVFEEANTRLNVLYRSPLLTIGPQKAAVN